MSDMLSIGSSGVSAYQRALATVSNNIANVNTEGYARQDIQIASNQPRLLGGGYLGTGVRFDAVRRQYDAFIESNLRNSSSELMAQEPLLNYVNRLIDIMGDGNIGLTTAMNAFFQSSRDLASDPASTVQRSVFLRDADGLASRFRQLSSQFETLRTETAQAVDTTLGQINALTTQLAQLNKQLSKHADVDSQPSELLDQRDLLLRNLSELTAIKTTYSNNGSVLVSVGDTINQGILVKDTVARAISVQTSETEVDKLEFIIDAYGVPESLPYIPSGQLGGIMGFRDQVLAPASNALNDLAREASDQINRIHRQGIDAEGRLGEDLFAFTEGKEGQAGGLFLAIADASRIAAAGQFRVIDDPLNPGSAQGRISYDTPTYSGQQGLAGILDEAIYPRIETQSFSLPSNESYAPVGVVQAGTRDVFIRLNEPQADQFIHVLTRDGMHLLGRTLNDEEQGWMIKTANGMENGAQYNTSSLNAVSLNTYMDMDLFLGAKAVPQEIQQFNPVTGAPQDPILQSAALIAQEAPFIQATAFNRDGVFVLNGVALNRPATAIQSVNDIATWLNSYTNTGVASTSTGVVASVVDGKLTLRLANGSLTEEIRLGLGADGQPADLADLGFETSVYLKGTAQDDLMIFISDRSDSPTLKQASVSVQLGGADSEMKQILRAHGLEVEFTSNSEYLIRDTLTNSLLATRQLDLASIPTIEYRGLKLELTNMPVQGDVFRIDGNKDGIGNNENMLRIADLEKAPITPQGLTLTEAYIERVNVVGNVARQATISQEALNVVYRQAKEARDAISGVSLDEEASSLVRFQQAYQANAKVMQVASQLFDTILQVRA